LLIIQYRIPLVTRKTSEDTSRLGQPGAAGPGADASPADTDCRGAPGVAGADFLARLVQVDRAASV